MRRDGWIFTCKHECIVIKLYSFINIITYNRTKQIFINLSEGGTETRRLDAYARLFGVLSGSHVLGGGDEDSDRELDWGGGFREPHVSSP